MKHYCNSNIKELRFIIYYSNDNRNRVCFCLQGRFFDYPGDTISRSSEFLRVKGDVCDPAGCLSELCIQLAIIMIGKQVFNNFLELFNP